MSTEAAINLLMQASDNGGGLELRDIFGSAAEEWTALDEIIPAIQSHEALNWCLQEPRMLELERDDALVPPVWFTLTSIGETLVRLRSLPAELVRL